MPVNAIASYRQPGTNADAANASCVNAAAKKSDPPPDPFSVRMSPNQTLTPSLVPSQTRFLVLWQEWHG